MTGEETRDYEKQWHLDKKIPIAIIVTIILQTSAVIWFAAGLFYRVEAVEKFQVIQAQALDRYQLSQSPNADRITRMEVKIENVERGVTRIENVLQARTPTGFTSPR